LGVAALLEFLGVRQRPWQPVLATILARPRPVDQRVFVPRASLAMAIAGSSGRVGRDPAKPAPPTTRLTFHLPPRIVRHRILVPVNGVHQGTLTALRYAQSISRDVTAVHVSLDGPETESLRAAWATWGEGVRLVVLPSPHDMILEPLLEYIRELMARRQDNEILTIVVPQSVRPRWWSNLLRTQMAVLLRLSLPLETGIVITDVPYDVEVEPIAPGRQTGVGGGE
jgi:hypothetical protein